jgi:uncharacterized protein YyaL (SSP411 family)
MPNQLNAERSLYLRQHADNPVDWMPWCQDVFERARQEDKLVFVSIGYAACHWCHVMEHESFEDREVADLLNQWFIPVKVDRQERPDLDAFYMTVCQAMTGHGGWPLTVILTPDKDVVVAGTYFPKRSTPYRIGLIELLERVHELWLHRREDVRASARELMQRIDPYLRVAEPGTIDRATCRRAVELLARAHDARYGGFGRQPKFPMASVLWFLLSWAHRYGDSSTLGIVTRTLDAMRWGGLWDHVGGGFHRYSTDERWFLPHFEKMLYDQALLLLVYAEAAVCTGNPLYRQTAIALADYMEQNLLLESGVYAAAEDADTSEGEGAYYQWRYDELAAILSAKDMARMCAVFSVTKDGNAHDEASGEPTGRNILYAGTSTADVVDRFGGSLDAFMDWWEPLRRQLLAHRTCRPRPLRDDQILCDWNALAMAALARAGRLLQEPTFVERAERLWAYLARVHRTSDGGLVHCSYNGQAQAFGFLDDHALSAWGLLELYESTGKEEYRSAAAQLADYINTHFVTNEGVVLNAPGGDVPQMSEPSDGATVSAVGIVGYVEIALGLVNSSTEHYERAQRILGRYGTTVNNHPSSHTTLLLAYLLAEDGQSLSVELPQHEHAQLWNVLARCYDPFRLVAPAFVTGSATVQALLCSMRACSAPMVGWDQIEHGLMSSTSVPGSTNTD